MDLLQACINCGIAIKERIRRQLISSLPPDMIVLLSEWLTSELPPHSSVCGDCYNTMTRCLATNSRERQFGHINVCFGCGKSVARGRRHSIPEFSPVALVVSSWHHHTPSKEIQVSKICSKKAGTVKTIRTYLSINSAHNATQTTGHTSDKNEKDDKLLQAKQSRFIEDRTISNTELRPTKKRKRKQAADVLLPEADDIIASVYKFLQAEYEFLKYNIGGNCDLSPLTNVMKRTADACGVCEYTVRHVLQSRPDIQSSLPEEDSSCGDSEIEHGNDTQMDNENTTCSMNVEINTTDSVDEFEDNVEPDNNCEEPEEFEVEVPNTDIDDHGLDSFDPLKTEPVDIKTESTDTRNLHTVRRQKPKCGISEERDNILTDNVSEVRVQCEETVRVKTEPTHVYLRSNSDVTDVTSLTTVKIEPVDDPPQSDSSTSDTVCDTTLCEIKREPPEL